MARKYRLQSRALLENKGYTVKELSKDASVSLPTVYKYFRNGRVSHEVADKISKVIKEYPFRDKAAERKAKHEEIKSRKPIIEVEKIQVEAREAIAKAARVPIKYLFSDYGSVPNSILEVVKSMNDIGIQICGDYATLVPTRDQIRKLYKLEKDQKEEFLEGLFNIHYDRKFKDWPETTMIDGVLRVGGFTFRELETLTLDQALGSFADIFVQRTNEVLDPKDKEISDLKAEVEKARVLTDLLNKEIDNQAAEIRRFKTALIQAPKFEKGQIVSCRKLPFKAKIVSAHTPSWSLGYVYKVKDFYGHESFEPIHEYDIKESE